MRKSPLYNLSLSYCFKAVCLIFTYNIFLYISESFLVISVVFIWQYNFNVTTQLFQVSCQQWAALLLCIHTCYRHYGGNQKKRSCSPQYVAWFLYFLIVINAIKQTVFISEHTLAIHDIYACFFPLHEFYFVNYSVANQNLLRLNSEEAYVIGTLSWQDKIWHSGFHMNHIFVSSLAHSKFSL